MSHYHHVVWEADAQHGGGREDDDGGQDQGLVVAVVEPWRDDQGAEDLADGGSGGQERDGAGELQVGPCGEPRLSVHQGEDRGVDEPADPHAHGECRGGLGDVAPGRAERAASSGR
jgi:hypothetical protein